MGLDVPVYKVGDRVYDKSDGCYLKAKVLEVNKTWYGAHQYVLRHELSGYETQHSRSHRDLDLLESQEDVQQRMARENRDNRINAERIEEENAMGAELYGYPPEEDLYTEEERREMAATKSRSAEKEAEIAQLKRENEQLRLAKVKEEYGEVTQRHLWDVEICEPMSWVGRRMRDEGRRTEIVTEGQSIIEASIVSEGIAKGISEHAYVREIKYNRALGTIK